MDPAAARLRSSVLVEQLLVFTEQSGDTGDGEDELGAAIDQAARASRLARAQCQGSNSDNRDAG